MFVFHRLSDKKSSSSQHPSSSFSTKPSSCGSEDHLLQLPDEVARSSIALYDKLPTHGKPVIRNNGVKEWTILATICLVQRGHASGSNSNFNTNTVGCVVAEGDDGATATREKRVIPVSLGTGVKCLPYSKLPEQGDTVHDCHAEIIARRGFVRWLLNQARLLACSSHTASTSSGSTKNSTAQEEGVGHGEEVYVEWKEDGSFGLKEGIETWMYVSMLPCGDASTLYTAAHQPASEASQWVESDHACAGPNPSVASGLNPAPASATTPLLGSPTPTSMSDLAALDPAVPSASAADSIRGNLRVDPSSRGHISNGTLRATEGVARGRNGYTSLSTLRTKPGRPDSIPSISMSCSDKLASWSVMGLQGALLTSLFRVPIYLDGIVIGGVDAPDVKDGAGPRVDEASWKVRIKEEVERALWGRLEGIEHHLPHPYKLHRPVVHFTDVPFSHSKASVSKSRYITRLERSNDIPVKSWAKAASDPISTPPPAPETIPEPEPEPAPSPLSLSYIPSVPPIDLRSHGLSTSIKETPAKPKPIKAEILTDGGLLGYPWKKGRLIREKGRSRICKLEIFRAYQEVVSLMETGLDGEVSDPHSPAQLQKGLTYHQAKHPPKPPTPSSTGMNLEGAPDAKSETRASASVEAVLAYQQAKRVLRGVPIHVPAGRLLKGLERFASDGLLSTDIDTDTDTERSSSTSLLHSYSNSNSDSQLLAPPFRGWLVSGEKFESFDSAGISSVRKQIP
ncbi:hypothetical protein IAU59_001993 [Kwoniella sp. CBS 9459]